MKNLILFISLALLVVSCNKESTNTKGSFEYTISGAASGTISGDDTNFGLSNGELFIRLTSGTDELILRILIDSIAKGSYEVNPIIVNMQNIPIEMGDAFADLNLGSVFSGNQRDFSTNGANGGSISLTLVEANSIEGTFNISLQELLSGGANQPEIIIAGQFTATAQ